MTQKTRNLALTVCVLAIGAVLLIWAAIDAQWVQTVSAEQVIDDLAAYKGKSLQIYGTVAAGSIKEQVQATGFGLFWPREEKPPTQTLPVRYIGLSKVNLIEGSDVLVSGTLNEYGVFMATKVLTKCPSKYKSVDSHK